MGRKSDARERLMKAVLELTVNGSFGSLRIDDICTAADVKKGSFYYFFPSKEALLVAALDDLWLHVWKPFLDEYFSPSLKPMERLRNYLDRGIGYYEEQVEHSGTVCGCGILALATEVKLLHPELAGATKEIFSRKRRYFESCIRDAIAEGEIPPGDPAKRAAGLWALIEGSLIQARVLNEFEPIRALPELAAAFLSSPMPEAASAPASQAD